MEISVLGTFVVGDAEITARQERLVLLALVAARPESIARDRLRAYLEVSAGAASGGDPLAPVLSRLKKRLGEGALVRDGGKRYRLVVGDGEVDLDRFVALCGLVTRRFSGSGRLEQLDAALALCPRDLWGEFAEEIADDPVFLGPLAQTVVRQRAGLVVERAVALLEEGRVAEAQAIDREVDAHPELLENSSAVAVLAEVRWADGRGGDALNAIALHRTMCVRRGLDFPSHLEHLEEALREAKQWAPRWSGPEAAVGPAGLAQVRADLRPDRQGVAWTGRLGSAWSTVGRWGDTLTVSAAVAMAAPRSTNAVAVSGRRGVGKSHFLEEVGRHLAASGVRVVWTRCVEGNVIPLAPISWLLEGMDPDGGTLGGGSGALDPSSAASLMLRAARDAPTAFVIDDVELADPASLAALDVLLARHTAGHPLWVVFSVDPDRVSGSVESARGLDSVLNNRNTVPITLAPLAEPHVFALVRDLLGESVDVAGVHALWKLSEGVPWHVVDLIRRLHANGLLRLDDRGVFFAEGALGRVAARRPGVVGGRGLSADAVAVLRSALLFGGEPTVGALAAMARLSEEVVLAAVAEVDPGVHLDRESVATRVRWSADLERVELQGLLPEPVSDRDRLHAVETLVDLGGLGEVRDGDWGDAEFDGLVTRLCSACDSPTKLAALACRSELAAILRRGAAMLERSGEWVAAAGAWGCVTVCDPEDAHAWHRAGRAWMRAHDGTRANDLLSVAATGADQAVAAEAVVDLCRTHASLEVRAGGTAAVRGVEQIAIEWSAAHPGERGAIARLDGVRAEWASVLRRHEMAASLVAGARLTAGSLGIGGVVAGVEFSAGVADMLAARPVDAAACFGRASAADPDDGWLGAWCDARRLLCRALTEPTAVTRADVVHAKSTTLAVQSWSDVLVTCVAAAQVALFRGELRWARTEIEEASETEPRAGYPLAAEPLRMLRFLIVPGEAPDVGSGWLSPLSQLWLRATSGGPENLDRSLVSGAVSGVLADVEIHGVDMYSAPGVVMAADLALASGLGDVVDEITPHLRCLVDQGHRAVLGVAVDLQDLLDRAAGC